VNDVKQVFEDSINSITTNIIFEETGCVDDLSSCANLTYDLSIAIISRKLHFSVEKMKITRRLQHQLKLRVTHNSHFDLFFFF